MEGDQTCASGFTEHMRGDIPARRAGWGSLESKFPGHCVALVQCYGLIVANALRTGHNRVHRSFDLATKRTKHLEIGSVAIVVVDALL